MNVLYMKSYGINMMFFPPQSSPLSSRSAVLSSQMRHSNLSVIYYSVLLQMCKAHGIGFDVQVKKEKVITSVTFALHNLVYGNASPLKWDAGRVKSHEGGGCRSSLVMGGWPGCSLKCKSF